MRAEELCPNQLQREPELATLAVLDVALMAARAALIAEHPDAGNLGLHAAEPLPSLAIVAALLVDRAADLRCLLTRYWQALDDFRAHHDDRQAEFPF